MIIFGITDFLLKPIPYLKSIKKFIMVAENREHPTGQDLKGSRVGLFGFDRIG